MHYMKTLFKKLSLIRPLAVVIFFMMISCSENPVSDQDQNCEPGPYFTHLPVDREEIASFNVIGQFNPPGDIAPNGQTGLQLRSRDLTPIYAVGDIVITLVESTHWIESPNRQGHTDYTLSFEIGGCRQIYGNYEHIASLMPQFLEQLEGSSVNCEVSSNPEETVRQCRINVQIPVEAGTLLGQAGGTTTGLDFDLFDRRQENFFVSDRFEGPILWAICPQSLFIDSHRDFLLSITGLGDQRRSVEPICGTMEVDVEGTAQGMWVLDGHDVKWNFDNFDKFFALAPDFMEPDKYHLLVTAQEDYRMDPFGHLIFYFPLQDDGRVNRRFSELSNDGTIYCYEPRQFETLSFFAALGSDGKVSLERIDHEPRQSPCQVQSQDSWAFTDEMIRLMR